MGTTAVRSLETAAQLGRLRSAGCPTRLLVTAISFIPGFRFQVVDAMITNFHLPSTLIMLVAAFAGYEQTMNAIEKLWQRLSIFQLRGRDRHPQYPELS